MDNKNKKITKAFSLVELIVWITISMILMVSIWIFISSWMQNIYLQKKSIENSYYLNDFASDLYGSFWSLSNTWQISIIWDWIIFKRNQEFDKWWFSYIWLWEIDKYFCNDDESEDTRTNHLFIKNFIPFIENWEDINNFEEIYQSSYINFNWINYKSLQKEHKVIDSSWNTIIWKWIFWYEFFEWAIATDIFLNSPTWLATDWEVLYISDTLNNRILYMSWTTIHKLLDKSDWLLEPTWLYYDSTEKSLYIANSWKWEILKISSEILPFPNLEINMNWVNESNINRIYLDFFKNWISYNIDSADIDTSNFNDILYDSKIISNNTLSYTFRNATVNSSWAIIWYTNDPKNFIASQTYQILLSNLSNFSEHWNYSINLRVWNTNKYYYYFTQWDEKIYNIYNNKVEIIRTWLNYPNAIWWNPWTNLSPNNWNFSQFNINSVTNLNIDIENDIILQTPASEIEISEDNEMINIIAKYYRNYNCYNLDQNSEKINTFLWKINIR